MAAAVDVRDDDGVRRITFTRPEKLNALLVEDLRAVTRAMTDETVRPRAAVFTGAGERAFSAGMHLDSFQGIGPAEARALITAVRDCLASVRLAPYPTIAAINGHCLGAAFELALACDLRVAVERATVGLPEIKVGIPSVVDAALLQQYVGLSLAKEMILTGDLYPVTGLERFGLFNAIAPAEQLLDATQRLLDRVANWTPTVVAAQKRLFELWQNVPLAEGIDASVEEFAHVFTVAETAAHVTAYREQVTGE